MKTDDLCQGSTQQAISIDTLWMQDSHTGHLPVVTCCQNNQNLETSPAIEHIGCRLKRIGRFPHRSSNLNKTCDSIVTSCSSTVMGIAKILPPKASGTSVGEGLGNLLPSHYPQVQSMHTCSELRDTLSKEATRFNSHTFCFYNMGSYD